MKKLTLKWKFFHIINILQLIVILFLTLGTIASLPGSKSKTLETVITLGVILILIVIALCCILNIFIVNRFFPDKALTTKIKKLLNMSRIAMIVFTSLAAFITVAGIVAFSTEPEKQDDFDIIAISFFGVLLIFCLYITILQFQIPRYLNQQSTGSINQLIDSIGK